jgi:hypothetical protein
MRDVVESGWVGARSRRGRLSLDAAVGNLPQLELIDGARRISPLATAPWARQPATDIPEAMAPVERTLSGDFFCAPFGASDVEDAPPHGWSANSSWTVTAATGSRIEAVLDRPVMGATIRKVLEVSSDAPLLFQEHRIEGGTGALTVAHHPMVRLAGGGRFTCSEKRAAITPDAALEPGRARLARGAVSRDITRMPGADGDLVDLTRPPIAAAHEDFVTLVEADGQALGWSAVLREEEDDIVFFLKDASVLPVTMLWHSNGGRDYPPWNGTHRGVLGIEDGCAAGADGHRAALARNPVSALGVRTSLPLGAGVSHRIAHVTGAIARPAGWSRVTDIRLSGDHLILDGDRGEARSLPFPSGFFAKEA